MIYFYSHTFFVGHFRIPNLSDHRRRCFYNEWQDKTRGGKTFLPIS
ncbi:hypothetical protein HMPREF1378_01931 [Enterococcus faecium R496]|uniref:Uncharacterized protein n=1 Tax=Enterococcus faecium R496 TaxID=1134836 RepID=A0AAV3GV48_ENTFC|nr:hypothetical protein HMPREF1382_02104 [Enterococcus faecium S447]EJX51927.1 hypothetical protein HMPREF1378_01931 [Enterococcus faecium R496]EJX61116.1 hypothetical protein HMPREF1376_02171 [Enterococcus faecium R446]EJX72201.1 hypothetical protein HMPREF1373_01057 [Enterococcus faecium P1140]EJX94386.1 hypothetical protein HMPREF1366_01169 [Enterococcus faecium ERV26]EJX99074.1 hypothetical protein HMPREF1364_01642 [Enterococcus faecium ERV165]EJY00414.1 hypothetical protein HMPREF1362_02